MALDRNITWPADSANLPTVADIGKVCEDFTLGIATRVSWDGGRWFIDLPGTCTHPLRRITTPPPYEEPDRNRWIEVWMGIVDGRVIVDVMTRQHDAVTNAIADGLAEVIARWWQGTREPM